MSTHQALLLIADAVRCKILNRPILQNTSIGVLTNTFQEAHHDQKAYEGKGPEQIKIEVSPKQEPSPNITEADPKAKEEVSNTFLSKRPTPLTPNYHKETNIPQSAAATLKKGDLLNMIEMGKEEYESQSIGNNFTEQRMHNLSQKFNGLIQRNSSNHSNTHNNMQASPKNGEIQAPHNMRYSANQCNTINNSGLQTPKMNKDVHADDVYSSSEKRSARSEAVIIPYKNEKFTLI
jgi:hypothetical protein